MLHELMLATGAVVTWESDDGEDAARRYVDTFRGAVVAKRGCSCDGQGEAPDLSGVDLSGVSGPRAILNTSVQGVAGAGRHHECR